MVATGAIWDRHLPNGGIQWLQVNNLDVLHWEMCPALHRHIPMAVKIASVFPAYVCIFDFVLNHNRS